MRNKSNQSKKNVKNLLSGPGMNFAVVNKLNVRKSNTLYNLHAY